MHLVQWDLEIHDGQGHDARQLMMKVATKRNIVGNFKM